MGQSFPAEEENSATSSIPRQVARKSTSLQVVEGTGHGMQSSSSTSISIPPPPPSPPPPTGKKWDKAKGQKEQDRRK